MPAHLYDLLVRRASEHAQAIALGGQQGLGWRTLTSVQLLELTDRLAQELAALGIEEGDRVVLWVPNQWRTPIYLFALWKLGAIAVPFDREMNPEGAARILASVEPRRVIVGYGERPAWARGDEVMEWWEPGSRQVGAGGAQSASWQPPEVELAAIFFTSGTTGVPKGCMITHANLCFQAEALQYTVPLGPDCRLASVLPLSHLFELAVGLLYPISQGAAIHYAPSRRGPDILRVLQEQRITHIIAVPQLLTLMGAALDERIRSQLPRPLYTSLHAIAPRVPKGLRRAMFFPVHRALGGHLRMMASGGAALPAETQLLWERLGVRVVEGYGTSECSPVVACGAGDGSTPVGSVGQPLRGVEVLLSEEAELLVKGPNVMRGYWKDPERTEEVLRDGWYATGDMASVDEAGNMRILGRVKDLIVLPSGMKVWPQDVEDVLREHPAIGDAAVLAVPGVSGGATLHAYLIPKRGAFAEAPEGTSGGAGAPTSTGSDRPARLLERVVADCNGRLAVHQRVATASWWPEADFPRTSTLKVKRNLLPPPEAALAVRVEAALAADDPVGQAIAGAARVTGVQPLQTLGELGLDSLGLVELAIALEEKTGKRVEEDALRLDMTLERVKTMLAAAAPVEESTAGGTRETWRAEQPLWPYTWGRCFRALALPVDLLYRLIVTHTVVLGREHLEHLPARLILAGTHHGFPDMPLVRHALGASPARHLASRLAPAAAAGGWSDARLWAWYGVLAFGLYPLRQYRERDASLRRLFQVADAGNAVLIFPQGVHADPEQERAQDPEVRFRTGVAHLATALNAQVLPFGVAGTEALMPPRVDRYRGALFGGIPLSFTRGPLAIAFGPPLAVLPDETAEEFTERLQEVCYALTRQAEEELG